jgi:hypothetical protein
MGKKIFQPAEILLPRNADMTKWSVIACDQFTSEPDYWKEAEELVGSEPSTLHMILPEAYLGKPGRDDGGTAIRAVMDSYLDTYMFLPLPGSFVYTERRLAGGNVRRGLVGALDLEAYDYRNGSSTPIRATEGTVESRLPPRVAVREEAALELPHVMILIDDPEKSVIEPLTGESVSLEKLYDFELMLDGGHVAGWRVSGTALKRTERELARLATPGVLGRKYGNGGAAPLLFAVGDGNHSLATAKLCWEKRKAVLSPAERENDPARYALVELGNVHDDAVRFEPIHRVLFDTDAAAFAAAAEAFWNERKGSGHSVTIAAGGGSRQYAVGGLTIGQLIAAAEELCGGFLKEHGGSIDYVHGDDAAMGLARQPDCCAVLLPAMDKAELFPSVMRGGAFPRKSFSIGHARDKRYYLECRRIR